MPHTAYVRFIVLVYIEVKINPFLIDVDTKIIKMNKQVEFSGCLANVITIMIRLR